MHGIEHQSPPDIIQQKNLRQYQSTMIWKSFVDYIFAYLYCEFFNVKLGFDAQQKRFL